MRVGTTAILVAVGMFVQACVFPVGGCSRKGAPEFSATEERITRNDVVAVLGEPLESIRGKDGRIDLYEYDGHCAGLMFIGAPFPFFGRTDQMLTVKYGPDDSFLTAKVWADGETPEVIIAYSKGRMEYEADRRVKGANIEKRARAGDPEAIWELAHALDDATESWKWFCLAAHQGLPKAQHHLGNYYRRGYDPISRDAVRAYLWYALAGTNMDFFEIEGMTPNQIAEAKRLAAEWQSNPAECDVEVVSQN